MIAFTKYLIIIKNKFFISFYLLALPINSLTHDAKGTSSYYFICFILRLLIRLLIQDLFHQLSTCFSTFPSRYYSLSLNDSYLALEDGSPNSDRLSSILLFLFKLCFIPFGNVYPSVKGCIIICYNYLRFPLDEQIII